MIRILQVGKFFHPEKGGIESVSKSLIDNIDSTAFSMDILCFNTTSETRTDLYNTGKVTRCGILFSFFSAPFSFRFFQSFFQMHRKYDIIHIHTPNPFALIALFFVKPSAKLIIHWHSDILKKGVLYWLIKPVERMALTKATVITGTSATYIRESEPLKPFAYKTNFIPIGTNMHYTDVTSNGIAAIKRKYAGKKIVFSLGRLVSYKGFEYLIEAASDLPDDVVIVIGGEGPLQKEYHQRIQKKKLDSRVFLQGRIPDDLLQDYFQACDLFCLPSCEKSEAFGVVIIEALSFGKPVIATNIPGSGVSWVNQHGVTGLNVLPGNPAALSTAITELLSDPERLKQMGKAAVERYQRHFTETSMQEAFEQLYHQLVNN